MRHSQTIQRSMLALLVLFFVSACGPDGHAEGNSGKKAPYKPLLQPEIDLSSYLGLELPHPWGVERVTDVSVHHLGRILIVGNLEVQRLFDDLETVIRPFIAKVDTHGELVYFEILTDELLERMFDTDILGSWAWDEQFIPWNIQIHSVDQGLDGRPHIYISRTEGESGLCFALASKLSYDLRSFEFATEVAQGFGACPGIIKVKHGRTCAAATISSPGSPQRGWVTVLDSAGIELAQRLVAWGMEVRDIDVDATGHVVVVGNGLFGLPNDPEIRPPGVVAALIVRLTPDLEEIVYAAYLGGEAFDDATGVTVDKLGRAYITGYTVAGSGFPLVNPLEDRFLGRDSVAFISIFSPLGALEFSTTFGGSNDDAGAFIERTKDGILVVSGRTRSPDLPTVKGLQPYAGSADAFVLALCPSKGVLFSTYLGGSSLEEIGWSGTAGGIKRGGMGLDLFGRVTLVGLTTSEDFPLVRPFFDSLEADTDGFVTRVSLYKKVKPVEDGKDEQPDGCDHKEPVDDQPPHECEECEDGEDDGSDWPGNDLPNNDNDSDNDPGSVNCASSGASSGGMAFLLIGLGAFLLARRRG